MVLPRACGRPLPPASFFSPARRAAPLLLAGLVAACGESAAEERAAPGSSLCDGISAFAQSGISAEFPCPPASCDVVEAGYRCTDVASLAGGFACTEWTASSLCASPCAPPFCYFVDDTLLCDPGCSEDGATCYEILLTEAEYDAACAQ